MFDQRSRELDGVLSNRWETFWDITSAQHASVNSGIGGLLRLLGSKATAIASLVDSIFNATLSRIVTDFARRLGDPPTAADLATHNAKLQKYAEDGYPVVLIAHSQGNLFVNSAFDTLRTSKPDAPAKVVHIAPASPTLRGDYAPAPIYTGTSLYSLTGSTRIRFLQLQIPLLLRYRLGHGPVLQPYLNAGPCYGQTFSNSSAIVYRYSNRTEDETLALQLSDRFSLGYVAGAGVLIRRRTGPSLNLEVRFDQVVDAPNNVYYTPQHKSLRLDVGVIF